jgi:hypothetical protein
MQDVGSVRPQVGPEILPHLRLTQLMKIVDELVLRVAPGEVSVRLTEAELGQSVHDLGPREGLRQKDELWMLGLKLAEHVLPKGKGLGVGVINPEDRDPLLDPELENALELGPQLSPSVGAKIKGIDVLVLLRRVLGELHRTIGPPLEPLGMLRDIGMVRRTLKGDIESYLQPMAACRFDQPAKIFEGAQLRVDALVAPCG